MDLIFSEILSLLWLSLPASWLKFSRRDWVLFLEGDRTRSSLSVRSWRPHPSPQDEQGCLGTSLLYQCEVKHPGFFSGWLLGLWSWLSYFFSEPDPPSALSETVVCARLWWLRARKSFCKCNKGFVFPALSPHVAPSHQCQRVPQDVWWGLHT